MTVANPLPGHHPRADLDNDTYVTVGALPFNMRGGREANVLDVGMPAPPFITHSLRADGFDASEDGTGRGTPLIASTLSVGGHNTDPVNETLVFDYKQSGETDPTMRALGHDKSHANGGDHLAVAFDSKDLTMGTEDCFPTLGTNGEGGHSGGRLAHGVRRLTPVECEKLQGFPSGYTAIPYRGKPAADGPRYRALGNSFAVPVIRWIGQRIQMVEDLTNGTRPSV